MGSIGPTGVSIGKIIDFCANYYIFVLFRQVLLIWIKFVSLIVKSGGKGQKKEEEKFRDGNYLFQCPLPAVVNSPDVLGYSAR